MKAGDAGFLIREATVDDAQGIASVHVTAWQETYGPLLPEGGLGRPGCRCPRLAVGGDYRGGKTILVAEDAPGIVAWATEGTGRDDDVPVARELEGIYALTRVHGSGVGQQLLDASIGDEPAYLWILDGNDRAEAFYRRNGFRRDGAEREHLLAGHPRTPVRMVRGS